MRQNYARGRTQVGMALVKFFSWVRGEKLSYWEYTEAADYADDFVFRDEMERQVVDKPNRLA